MTALLSVYITGFYFGLGLLSAVGFILGIGELALRILKKVCQ